ncbi:SufBD protein [Desulfurococcaceae archaeon AG1]|nr:MAG: hypothetical protein DJ555_02155 [Desulfurococcaceae archaeon]GAY25247.1 SufBD protein [Desulfurococcaceae archaeon AG1]
MAGRYSEILGRALKLYNEIPYQYIADSPTIRFYTDWSVFDKYRVSEAQYPCEDTAEGEYDLVISGGCVRSRGRSGVRVKPVVRSDLDSLDPDSPLFKLVRIEDSKIYAMHVAGYSAGAIIYIDKDLDEPLRIKIAGGSLHGHLAQHVSIVVGEGVYAKIQIATEPAENALRTTVEEITLMPGARLEISNILRNSPRAPSFHASHYLLLEGSEVMSGLSAIAGNMSRIQQRAVVEGRGARHMAFGAAMGGGENRVHYIENAVVRGRDSRAVLNVRGIAADSARTVVQAFAIQEEESFGSGTNVEAATLTIGRGALAVTLPMLEVRCGDVVEARHAASQAILDVDVMTYLRSRGLSIYEAVKLMTYDYIVEPFQDLPEWMVPDLVNNIYNELDKIDFESLKIL